MFDVKWHRDGARLFAAGRDGKFVGMLVDDFLLAHLLKLVQYFHLLDAMNGTRGQLQHQFK